MLHQRVSGSIPTEEAMHYRAPETHLLSGFGSGVERVVVTVQSIQPSSASFRPSLEHKRPDLSTISLPV